MRTNGRKCKAVFGGFDGHALDRLLDRLGVVDFAGIGAQARPQQRRVDGAHIRHDVDRPDPVLLAFLDHERDRESPARRIVLADRRNDAHVDEAVLEIEAPHELAIRLQSVRVVDVGRLQERQQSRGRGLDHVLQPVR
jgi:hypothetical protein